MKHQNPWICALLLALVGCSGVGLSELEDDAVLATEFRTVFPDIRGVWSSSFTLFDGTDVKIVLDIVDRTLPQRDIGGAAYFYGAWRMTSNANPGLSWLVPYDRGDPEEPVPASGVVVAMPGSPGSGDAVDSMERARMIMLLVGPCSGTRAASNFGEMGEFSGRVGLPATPFSVDPRLILAEVQLPIFQPSCERLDLYELGMVFRPYT